MNIFFLDKDPVKAARYHCDKHVVKMILESAQLLSTAHRLLDERDDDILYRATHKNHPCAIWVRESSGNYSWLYNLFVALCDEYTYRYDKIHLTDSKLRKELYSCPNNIPFVRRTKPAQAMPEKYRDKDPVIAYRNYYNGDKAPIATWKKRDIPEWFRG